MKIDTLEKAAELLSSMDHELDTEALTKREKELESCARLEVERRASVETELRTVKGQLKEVQEGLRKVQEQNLRLERDLARSLGYIDRVIELEAPPPEPVLIQEQRRLEPRGPRLGDPAPPIPDSFFRR